MYIIHIIHIYIYIYMYVHTCVCVCVCIYTYIYILRLSGGELSGKLMKLASPQARWSSAGNITPVRLIRHIYMYIYYIHTDMHTYLHACMHTNIHTSIYTYSLYIYICTHTHTTHTHTRTLLLPYMCPHTIYHTCLAAATAGAEKKRVRRGGG